MRACRLTPALQSVQSWQVPRSNISTYQHNTRSRCGRAGRVTTLWRSLRHALPVFKVAQAHLYKQHCCTRTSRRARAASRPDHAHSLLVCQHTHARALLLLADSFWYFVREHTPFSLLTRSLLLIFTCFVCLLFDYLLHLVDFSVV
jgi:hypothetical protein